MWSHIAFSICLLAVSASLIGWQLRYRKAARRRDLDPCDRDFLQRQFRRRLQVNVMIGAVGAAVLGGLWVTSPIATLVYWSVVVLLVCWIGLMAFVDLASTRVHLERLHQGQLDRLTALRSELQQLRRKRREGQAAKESEDS